MRAGELLEDIHGAPGRFRVEGLLAEGRHYQIALARDDRMDDKLVCAKVIDYEAEHLEDTKYVQGRRRALRTELEFLTVTSHLIPEPLDWLELEGGPAGGSEPALIYEYQHGQTLHELVTEGHPRGLRPARALRIFRELVRFCQDIHAQGWIFRDFDPRHIIVGFDDIIHVVGCGSAVARGERMNVYKMGTDPAYTAPEIRRELSGKVVRPACDLYSLGCLLSFMLTGIEPTAQPESPLGPDAYEELREGAPEGLRLIIARCLQPLAQKRFSGASKLLPYCEMGALPGPNTDGFGLLELPAPWSGPEGADNRAARSRLSPGPLISVKDGDQEPAEPAPAPTPAKEEPPEEPLAPRPEQAPAAREPADQGRRTLMIIVAAGLMLLLATLGLVIVAVVIFGLGL